MCFPADLRRCFRPRRWWTPQSEPTAGIPESTAPVKLTRPLILFAVIRAVAVSITLAIAFGLHLPNADWMPIAALAAMKSSLQQSTLAAGAAPGRGDHRRRSGCPVPADR